MKQSMAGVAPDFLAPVYLDRFLALFSVAARKSLLQWRCVAANDAQLALVDANTSSAAVPASTPCVIFVGEAPAPLADRARSAGAGWVSHLPAEFTVSDLIDALDRAAVFLMDWSARQKANAAKAKAEATAAAVAAAPNQDDQYQLTSWVSLEAPFNTGPCVRALALLTRAPIDLGQLCGHSGLDVDTARSLIASLNRRGVLRHSARQSAVLAAAENTGSVKRGRAVRAGLIQRLSRWVGFGGRA